MGKKRQSPGSVIGGDGDDESRMVMIFGINPIFSEARISVFIDTRFRRHMVSGMIGRKSGKSQGYAFLEFDSEFVADKFRQEYNGKEFVWTNQRLQLRWASSKQLQLLENQERKKEESNCNGKPEKPIWVLNYPGENYDGNQMLRVDGLEPWFMSFDLKMSIPWAFRRHVLDSYPVQDPKKFKTDGYGFIQFISHDSAQRFLEKYNGSPIPGTNMHFQLSWAPFSDPGDHDKVFNDDDNKLDEPGESDNEALADQKNEYPDPLRSEEIMDPPYSKIKKSDIEEVDVMEFLNRTNYSIISPLAIEKAEGSACCHSKSYV